MDDPIVKQVREAREAYAAEFDHDLDRIFADLEERQKRSGRTYVTYPRPAIQEPSAPPMKDHLEPQDDQ